MSDCPICHEAIVPSETGRWETSCGHAYHLKCFVDWLHTGAETCPMCRKVGGEMERPTKKEGVQEKRRGNVIGLQEWVTMTTSRYNNDYIASYNTIPIMNAEPPLTPEEEMGYPSADIAIVASESGVSLRQATQALHTYHGDIVNAIIALTTPPAAQANPESQDIYYA